jgi:hypothetical protein
MHPGNPRKPCLRKPQETQETPGNPGNLRKPRKPSLRIRPDIQPGSPVSGPEMIFKGIPKCLFGQVPTFPLGGQDSTLSPPFPGGGAPASPLLPDSTGSDRIRPDSISTGFNFSAGFNRIRPGAMGFRHLVDP